MGHIPNINWLSWFIWSLPRQLSPGRQPVRQSRRRRHLSNCHTHTHTRAYTHTAWGRVRVCCSWCCLLPAACAWARQLGWDRKSNYTCKSLGWHFLHSPHCLPPSLCSGILLSILGFFSFRSRSFWPRWWWRCSAWYLNSYSDSLKQLHRHTHTPTHAARHTNTLPHTHRQTPRAKLISLCCPTPAPESNYTTSCELNPVNNRVPFAQSTSWASIELSPSERSEILCGHNWKWK